MGSKNMRGSSTSSSGSKGPRDKKEASRQITTPEVKEIVSQGPMVDNRLKFKSYQTGTLITMNFEPLDKPYNPVKGKASKLDPKSPPFVPKNTKKSGQKGNNQYNKGGFSAVPASARKTEKPVMTLTGTEKPTPTGRTVVTRADYRNKDVVIESSSVTRNIVRLVEEQFANGFRRYAPSGDFSPGKYNFLEHLDNMAIREKENFWGSNYVEIVVDIGELNVGAVGGVSVGAMNASATGASPSVDTKTDVFTNVEGNEGAIEEGKEHDKKKPTTIFDMMAKLGPEFVERTKTVFVTLAFPENGFKLPITGSYIPQMGGNRHRSQGPLKGAIDFDSSPSLAHVKALVAYLQGFKSLKRLDITLQTPTNQPKPIEVPQLDHCLPFYDLVFTDWKLWWKAVYMTKPHEVDGWPIGHLDNEWAKICMQREKDIMAVERATFVHKSKFFPVRS
ncbi:uncharacterized protein BP5553_00901 [Venustampulla echinocandica]|uniref:Uncharacterized protein n=1 Tax=Venustampulla echinocandica TaxID=2656787 RepID=A0A370TZG6_9HELO|nr:uncharacterized protein BP5553_00901 [Venustampulla echinocandica]RDL40922.1 hypothetical protein BP5553_00901 [Venustampulla echinocandica]